MLLPSGAHVFTKFNVKVSVLGKSLKIDKGSTEELKEQEGETEEQYENIPE